MDNFISSINTIKESQDDLYITYFLYRVWIKNRLLVEYVLSVEDFNKVLTLIGLPEEYHELQIIFPLNKFMTVDNKDKINKLIIQQLLDTDSGLKKLNSSSDYESSILNQYSIMKNYVNENNSVEIIQKKIDQIRKKIMVEKKSIYVSELLK